MPVRRDIKGSLTVDQPRQEPVKGTEPYSGGRVKLDALALITVTGDFSNRFPAPRSRYVLINPDTISESVSPQLSRRPVIGLSHEVIQYIRTNSRELSLELEMSELVAYRRFSPALSDGRYRTDATRAWFMGLTLPLGPGLAPPLVSITWAKGIKAFTGAVSSMAWEYERWSADGRLMDFALSITLIEVQYGLKTADKSVAGRAY